MTTFQLQLETWADRDRFFRLLEFADKGRIVSGWEDIEPDDARYDSESENILPIYDDTDRSDDPWYPLAVALITIGYQTSWATDNPNGLRIKTEPNNDEIALEAAESVGLVLAVVE